MCKKYLFFLLLILAVISTGCIENDLPYPTIKGEILEIDMEGMVSAKIADASATVNVKVADTVDLRDVRIKKLVVTEQMKVYPDEKACLDFTHFPDTGFVSADSLPQGANTRMNFREPVQFRLSLYQDYLWTVNVTHEINRMISVKNQVGQAFVDEYTHNVVIYVDSAAQPSFRNIEITSLQLGSSIATTEPDPATVSDFTRPRIFRVTLFGVTEEWTVSVQYPAAGMQTAELSAWAKRAYIKGTTTTGNVAVAYRELGETEWESMLSNELTVEGEDFLAILTHLRPGTDYEYQLTVDGKAESVETFRTDTVQQFPNLSFDIWYQDGKVWYPNADMSAENYFWDSGNKGTSIAGGKNPTSEEKRDVVKGSAIRMASEYVAVKFAAGNIYSGSFVDIIGMRGAMLDFGRPYTGRPSALKGYYKYTSGVIDNANGAYTDLMGQKDSCHIYVALFDWTAPFRVNTDVGTFVNLSWENESMIAFGELKSNQSISDYQTFRIPLTYRDYFTKPKYVVMVASASKYGDFFTGSTGSVLLLDECELVFE